MRSNNSFFVKAIGFGGGALLALLLMAGASYADSIGGPGSTCGTCQGSIYTLSYDGSPLPESPNDPANETFRVSLTIDTSGYNGGGSYLDQVAIKVAPSVVSASLFAAPGGTGL
ncbi:MAG TPA: hypothetical protein VKK81_08455, partial [Candidatus Binatia bacterium]|nr:hypothetical protein [Candidatus Binatia bacterium]